MADNRERLTDRGTRFALRPNAATTHVNDAPVHDTTSDPGGQWAIGPFTTEHRVSVPL